MFDAADIILDKMLEVRALQLEWVELDKDVVMQKMGAESIQVQSDSIIFKPDQDLVSSKDTVIINTGRAKITGDQAIFDLRNEVYSLKNTRAIYYHADS